jgi:hypothetical protein
MDVMDLIVPDEVVVQISKDTTLRISDLKPLLL